MTDSVTALEDTLRPEAEARFASIDQCRGFIILWMLFGNFLGHLSFMPWILQHHRTGLSLSETVAPIFFFLVGMGFRISFMRRMEKFGIAAACRAAVKRYLLIFCVGIPVYYGHWWDALTHIGMGGLLALPFIHRGTGVRAVVAVGYLALYQALFLYTPYGHWVMNTETGQNGGPLAALSWGFILIVGTLAWDMIQVRTPDRVMRDFLVYSFAFMVGGWLLSLPWPGVKDAWEFTRFGMSAPLPVYATGVAFATYNLFFMFCERHRIRFPMLTPIGRNPLVIYAVLGVIMGLSKLAISQWGEPVPLLAALIFVGQAFILYAVAVFLDRRHIMFRF